MSVRYYLLLSILIISVPSSCQKKSEDCIYVIPKDYEGNVLIVFEQKEGTDTLYEGKRRVYKIDTTGVLKTGFKPNYGIHHNLYISIDSNGKKTPINYFLPSQVQQSDDIVCFNHETGRDYDYKREKDRHFETFSVAKQQNRKTIIENRSSFISKMLSNK